MSISNVNEAAAQKNLDNSLEALEKATTDEEKTFRESEIETARIELAEAKTAVEEASGKLVAARGEAAAQSKDLVPKAGIMIVLIGLMCFIASHAFGQGACIWVFIGEIFPNTVRAQGQALGSFVHWVLAATITQLFPPLLALLGPSNIFLLFAGLMVMQFIWVVTVMPETKQVPLEEMQKKLGITDPE